MDKSQENIEKSIGDLFVEWFNNETGSNFLFVGRPDRAPDLHYSSNGVELFIEITIAYYDQYHATFIWKSIRDFKDAPDSWIGVNARKSLVESILKRINTKSQKRYGRNTILLIEIPPGVTSSEELEEQLRGQSFQVEKPFCGVYVVGYFPITNRSSGGYRVIPIKSIDKNFANLSLNADG